VHRYDEFCHCKRSPKRRAMAVKIRAARSAPVTAVRAAFTTPAAVAAEGDGRVEELLRACSARTGATDATTVWPGAPLPPATRSSRPSATALRSKESRGSTTQARAFAQIHAPTLALASGLSPWQLRGDCSASAGAEHKGEARRPSQAVCRVARAS